MAPLPSTDAARPTPRMGRRGLLGATLFGGLAGPLSGCTSDDPSAGTRPSTSPPTVRSDGPIRWANWSDYIDTRGKKRPTLDRFVADSGIRVDYTQPINDNAQFLDTVGAGLAAGDDIGYDVITLTSWAASRLVLDGQIQPFGPVPNGSNVISSLAAPAWDPEQRFSLPWQAGLTGIAYDARKVDRAIGSIQELLERSDLAGGVGLLTEVGDTVGMTLLSQGDSMTDLSEDSIGSSLDYLRERAGAGQFAGFYGNEYLPALTKGKLGACLAWSGDVLQAQLKNPYLKFVVPEEGLMIWSDNLIVPNGSTQAGAVAKLADYYYQPKVAAELAAWVNYICPVQGAQEEMAKFDAELAQSPLIFPDQTILDLAQLFPTLPSALFDSISKEFAGIAAS